MPPPKSLIQQANPAESIPEIRVPRGLGRRVEKKRVGDEVWTRVQNEYVEGYRDANGVLQWPVFSTLSERHKVPLKTIQGKAQRDKWRELRENFKARIETERRNEAAVAMAKDQVDFNKNTLNLAKVLMGQITQQLAEWNKGVQVMRRTAPSPDVPIAMPFSPDSMRSIVTALAGAQRIGRIALGMDPGKADGDAKPGVSVAVNVNNTANAAAQAVAQAKQAHVFKVADKKAVVQVAKILKEAGIDELASVAPLGSS